MHLLQSVAVSSLNNHSLLINPTIIILPSPSFPIKNGFCPFIKKATPHPIVLKSKGSNISHGNNNYWGDDDEPKQQVDEKKSDSYYMRKCVELAKKGIGHTSPDPMMGCIIVKDDVIIGQGFYSKAGETLPEVLAVKEAGKLLTGATAYMNIEPRRDERSRESLHWWYMLGGLKRVVIGTRDPNPVVGLKGVEDLRRDPRSTVTVGVEQKMCEKLNEAYIHQKLSGKPFLTLRCSVTINGYILDEVGEGAKECGGYYSRLLQEYDGVIFCSTSLKEKSSFPTSEEPGAKQPMQIIITPLERHGGRGLKFEDKVVSIVANDHETSIQEENEDQRIIEQKVLFLNKRSHEEGDVTKSLRKILDYCARRGLCNVLFDLHRNSECLEDLLEEGLELGLFQKVVMEVLPFWDSSVWLNSLQKLMNNLEKRGLKFNNSPLSITRDGVVVEGYFE